MKRFCLTALVWLGLTAAVSAQIMDGNNIPEEPAKPVTPGELTPYFWIGGQMIAVLGKNLEKGGSGISYSPNRTWVSMDVAFLDSHWDTPKSIASVDDPSIWSVSFKLLDPTARLNSYSTSPEVNYPSWTVGIQGYGWRFGALYEKNRSNGVNVGGDSSNRPQNLLFGATEVLYLGTALAGTSDYLKPGLSTYANEPVRVQYNVTGAGYASYTAADFYTVSLTAGSKDETKESKGYAGVVNFNLTPIGQGSYDEPLTYGLAGDLIAASGDGTHPAPLGFGLQGRLDYYFDDDVFVTPLVAFDGRRNDTWSGAAVPTGSYVFDWRAGGGVMLTLSPKRWVTDLYQEVPDQSAFSAAENAKIQKFTYVQALFDYSRPDIAHPNRDMNFIFKAEEPDGIVGMDDNWGGMAEFRLANLLATNPGSVVSWSAVGRVSYDLVQHTVTPYVQGYTDSYGLSKVRFGAQLEPVPGTAIEITYMTANLTGVTNYKGSALPTDAGRLEIIFGIATDPAFRLIKTMNFSYEGTE